jgi:hypothetical protein
MTDEKEIIERLTKLRDELSRVEADLANEQDESERQILEGESDILMDIIKLKEAQLRKIKFKGDENV